MRNRLVRFGCVSLLVIACDESPGAPQSQDKGSNNSELATCMDDSDCAPGHVCFSGYCRGYSERDDRGDASGGQDKDGGAPGSPDIVVDMEEMDFGSPLYGVEVCLDLGVHNDGSATLEMTDVELVEEDSMSEFAAELDGLSGSSLAPGAIWTINVCFTARDDQEDAGKLHLYSNDPDTPELVVVLKTEIKGEPRLGWCVLDSEVSPPCTDDEVVDFGEVVQRGTSSREVALWNAGAENRPLQLLAVHVTDALGYGEYFTVELVRADETVATTPLFLSALVDIVHAQVTYSAGDLGAIPMEALRVEWLDQDENIIETDIPFAGEVVCAEDDEICNGQDDDCDDEVDEGFGLGELCDGDDEDDCEDGIVTCDGCDDDPTSIVEVCNGEDDDCDGEEDEGFVLGVACDGDDLDDCQEGVMTCEGCTDVTGDSGLGLPCDGADPDTCNEGVFTCEGCTDETGDSGIGSACDGDEDGCLDGTMTCDGCSDTNGDSLLGQPCDGNDDDECDDGTITCDGCDDDDDSIVEVCNGADDDCDGETDEDIAAAAETTGCGSTTALCGVTGSVAGNTAGLPNEEGCDYRPSSPGPEQIFTWTAHSTGRVTFSTCGGGGSGTHVFTVFEGTTCSTTPLVCYYVGAPYNPRFCDDGGQSATFAVTAGGRYTVIVGGFDGQTVSFTLNWFMDCGSGDFAPIEIFGADGSSGPHATNNAPGGPGCDGNRPDNRDTSEYRFVWTPPDAGTASFSTTGGSGNRVITVYRDSCAGSTLQCRESGSTLFDCLPSSTYYIIVGEFDGDNSTFTLNWSTL